MFLIHWIAIVLLVAGFSMFIFLNLSFLFEKFQEMKKASLLGEGFFNQTRYFTLNEKDIGRVNAICAIFFGIGGLYMKIGIFGVLFGLVAGWFFPTIVIRYSRKKYFRKMDGQLYSALILLGNAMKAGETLPQAVDSTKGVLGYPISQEFDIISRQIRMGMTVGDALNNFAERVALDDVKLAVRAMIISLRTGANLPQALKKIADTIRERNALHQKINALTVQGKAQGIVVGLLPLLMAGLMYWSDPDYIRILFTTFLGNLVVAVMITLEVIAFVVIRKISTIKI